MKPNGNYHHYYHGKGDGQNNFIAAVTLIGGFIAVSLVVNTVTAVRTAVDPGYPERVEQMKIETENRQNREIADALVAQYQNNQPVDLGDFTPNQRLALKNKRIDCGNRFGKPYQQYPMIDGFYQATGATWEGVTTEFLSCIAS